MNNMQSSDIPRNLSGSSSQAAAIPEPMLERIWPQQNYTPNTSLIFFPYIPQISFTQYMQHIQQMPHRPNQDIIHNPPRNLRFRLCISESELAQRLRRHIIQPHMLREYGFPVECLGLQGFAEFLKPRFGPANENITQKNFAKNKDGVFTAFDTSFQINTDTNIGGGQIFAQRQCSRCQRIFHVARTGEYMNHETCFYHPEKFESCTNKYGCCGHLENSVGCSNNASHVWSGSVSGFNGPCMDFVQTLSGNRTPKVYALDCEMSYTGRGLEVTKLTVVDFKGDVAYEHYVFPECRIIDYNSRYSGITQNDFHPNSGNSIKSLVEVQLDLLKLFDSNTILIGHGLENDLCALRLIHTTIIDTSIAFPHPKGYPYRKGLKSLASEFLGRQIPCGDEGHSCLEDARASLELMMFKESTNELNV